MIRGRFGNTTTRPFVAAYVGISSISAQGFVSFLLDTGADSTVIMPTDAIRLGIDYNDLQNTSQSYGIGGQSDDFIENGAVVVVDPDERKLFGFNIQMRIASQTPVSMAFPSLFGRDIINQWRVLYDFQRGQLEIEIQRSDFSLPAVTPSI